ncbi:hypothetical protein HPB50_008920 [Hyalomma asiaticum]|uniref:Uncharacterized protein n=1 Tax=Hyalomma asiaticum TaxID=266040 RepID=A0ACB7THP1_HYAAI|nr:hypothetical protein HPB50_008920 [Hyalomma asiaticum]
MYSTDREDHKLPCLYVPLGLSFLALILLSGRLYEASKEIAFLRVVLAAWMPSESDLLLGGTDDHKSLVLDRTRQTLTNLKGDLEAFLLELTSARTTLALSVVFVIIYILSWWWMAFALKQAKDDGSVSLRTVLLLSVFAAVDIAASTGFVLLRIIMYVMRDRLYPMTMRTPYITEADQFAAFTALRLATLKSSCGTTDVLVSIVVGFLTGLRVQLSNNADYFSERLERLKDVEDYVPKPMIAPMQNGRHKSSFYVSSRPAGGGGSERGGILGAGVAGARLTCVTPTASTVCGGEENPEVKIQAADMPQEMQRAAVESATQAVKLYSTEKHVAESIKQDFDQMFQPTWHCVVGRNWGSCVTHSKQCYVRMAYRDMTILLYRSI